MYLINSPIANGFAFLTVVLNMLDSINNLTSLEVATENSFTSPFSVSSTLNAATVVGHASRVGDVIYGPVSHTGTWKPITKPMMCWYLT